MAAPRLLLIDMTPMEGAAATSALKRAYFSDWPSDSLLQVSAIDGSRLAIAEGSSAARVFQPVAGEARRLIDAFLPQIILYRPVAEFARLHEFAMGAIAASNAPLALWMMDDWPERLRLQSPARFDKFDRELRTLLRRSKLNLAISDGMAQIFSRRYGVRFEVVRNGVVPSQWPERKTSEGREITIRYSGSLAPDMTRDTVLAVANAASKLVRERKEPIKFEIRTQRYWYRQYKKAFLRLPGVSIQPADFDDASYRNWLRGADILLLAYNFDLTSRTYAQHSFANKTPELLASGAAVFAYGPSDFETIRFLKDAKAAEVFTEENPSALEDALSSLANNSARRKSLGEAGRNLALSQFDLARSKSTLRKAMFELGGDGGDAHAERHISAADTIDLVAGPAPKRGAKRIMKELLFRKFPSLADALSAARAQNKKIG